MEMEDYESSVNDNDTDMDECAEEKKPLSESGDSHVCELTVQFDCILSINDEELQSIGAPAFYEYFIEIARDDLDRPDFFDMPSGDVTWIPRVEKLLDSLTDCEKYLRIKDIIDKFMVDQFITWPRHKLRNIQEMYYDTRDLMELHGDICKNKYKSKKFRMYAVLQTERWLFTDVRRKIRRIRRYAKTSKPLVMRKFKVAMAYAKERLYSGFNV
jgi:hypothetical protein